MATSRAMKRTRADVRVENCWNEDPTDSGTYLIIKLKSGKTLKGRGWPYIQQCVRGIIGDQKVQKASLQSDGSLLVKTNNDKQTDKLLKATFFGAKECEISRHSRLNTSRGAIHAFDLIELTEDEVVGWLQEFGVIAAKRFTRRVDGRVENTPTILLTFNKPTCPIKIELDYVTYHVRRHIPNPLICQKCGKFGHAELRCNAEAVCLNCGERRHEGSCQAKCVNCGKSGHSCKSRDCSLWKKEREICELKVDRDISYAHTRRIYDQALQTPMIRPYASVVRSQSDAGLETVLRDRVEKLEQKVDKMISLLGELLNQQSHKHQPGTSAHTATAAATPLVTAVTPSPVPDHGLSSQDMDESGHEIDMSDIPLSGITQSEHNQHSSECDGSALKHPPSSSSEVVVGGKGKGQSSRNTASKHSEHDSTPSPKLERNPVCALESPIGNVCQV